MSALPIQALSPQDPGLFLKNLVENTDSSILSNDELYALKGGDKIFLTKLAVGLTFAYGYLLFSGRLNEVRNFHIQGKFLN